MATYHGTGNQEGVRQQPGGETHEDVETLTPLQAHYLRLLEHRLALKTTYQADPSREVWLLRALDRASYSAFRSCIEHGAEGQAKALLTNQHLAN